MGPGLDTCPGPHLSWHYQQQKEEKVSLTIETFQHDKAMDLADRIKDETGNLVSVTRIRTLMVKHGIVGEVTYWAKVENVLADLGFAYDEVFEVLAR